MVGDGAYRPGGLGRGGGLVPSVGASLDRESRGYRRATRRGLANLQGSLGESDREADDDGTLDVDCDRGGGCHLRIFHRIGDHPLRTGGRSVGRHDGIAGSTRDP